jgi:anti-anti-sigma factor
VNTVPGFSLEESRVFDVPVLAFSGEVDIASAGRFAECFSRASREAVVIACLDGVTYIDSTGLTVIIQEDKRRKSRGERILIILPAGHASRVFKISGLTTTLECFDDRVEAVRRALDEPVVGTQ